MHFPAGISGSFSCRCDLATLGQVSDAEDILEKLTGGAKVVRSQFCKVPVDLVIDCSKIEALNAVNEEYSAPGVLSHEALPRMTFRRNMFGKTSVAVASIEHNSDQTVASKRRCLIFCSLVGHKLALF